MTTLSAPTREAAANPVPVDPDQLATRRFLSTIVRDTSRNPRPHPAAMRVREVMRSGVVAAHEEAAFKEIVDAMIRNGISAVPVIDQRRRVVGMVSESDLLGRLAGVRLALPAGHLISSYVERRHALRGIIARDLMTVPAIVTTAETTVEAAAHLCSRSHVRRLPVVDDDHVLVGIVTRADLLRAFLLPDEEIRDDLRDRLNRIVSPADAAVDIGVAEGVVTLSGTVELRTLAAALIRHARAVSGVIAVDGSQLHYRVDDRGQDYRVP